MAFPHDGKKFEPGQSGNPTGLNAGRPSQAMYRELMDMKLSELPNEELRKLKAKYGDVTVRKAMGLHMMKHFFQGDAKDAVAVHNASLDRAEGKAIQATDLAVTVNDRELSPAEIARRMAFNLEQAVADEPSENPVTPSSSDPSEPA